MAIDYASIANQKKKDIEDYLANPNIAQKFSPVNDIVNRPDSTQGYKDILAQYTNSRNLDPNKIDSLTQKYLTPAMSAGRFQNKQALAKAKYNATLGNIQNQFTFPTDQWNQSQQELNAAKERANLTQGDLMAQRFAAEQAATGRDVAQKKSDIANQYSNTALLLGQGNQNQMQSDAIQQAMLRSIIGLGGIGGVGLMYKYLGQNKQPDNGNTASRVPYMKPDYSTPNMDFGLSNPYKSKYD